MGRRGQTFTLEAFVAAILLLATIAFALQVVSISSNTAGNADAEIGNQHVGLAQGVLDESAADGTLTETLLYWDASATTFHNAGDDGFYIARSPPTAFGDSLGAMFDARQVRYNVDLYFLNASGEPTRQRLVESGTPSEEAVRASRTVTLYDDSELLDATGTPTDNLTTVAGDSNREFYAPDAEPDSPLYNVVRVEVVLWQT